MERFFKYTRNSIQASKWDLYVLLILVNQSFKAEQKQTLIIETEEQHQADVVMLVLLI